MPPRSGDSGKSAATRSRPSRRLTRSIWDGIGGEMSQEHPTLEMRRLLFDVEAWKLEAQIRQERIEVLERRISDLEAANRCYAMRYGPLQPIGEG
jgi:hypothetical protein